MPCRLGVESEGQVVQGHVWLRLELRGQPLAVADVVDKNLQQCNLGGRRGGPNAEWAAESSQHVGCEGVGGECRQGGYDVKVEEGGGHAVEQLPMHAWQVVQGG